MVVSGVSGELTPEYWRTLYGDATISYVPPVEDYRYADNIGFRGQQDGTFRWSEVEIPLDSIATGTVIDFIMPDSYTLQFTPNIGWHDQLAMFGEYRGELLHNPHLVNLGPFSIEGGTLDNMGDNSVRVTLTQEQMSTIMPEGYPMALWRAVPWAEGNPGQGGLPASFTWISSEDQLDFVVDEIVKERKRGVQTISGRKSPRVSVSLSDETVESISIEQTSTTWKVTFLIDRSRVRFTIVAQDDGGSALATHYVDLEYEGFEQFDTHVWNTFDSFGLLASIERLPAETNAAFKERIIDAFSNKGASHYDALIRAINRELGLARKDSALAISRALGHGGVPLETSINIESNHTRLSISCSSFVIHNEIHIVDPYDYTIRTAKRIGSVLSINNLVDVAVPAHKWELLEDVEGNTIRLDPSYQGKFKVSYSYKEDVPYEDYPRLGDVADRLNNITNPGGLFVVVCTVDPTMSAVEPSKYLYKTTNTVSAASTVVHIGWSRVGLYAVSDEEYKWSFADEHSMFFDSEFYQFVVELKSSTNIEWGFVVADEDFWDAIDADVYGKDSLPIAFDPATSHYVTAVPVRANSSITFDPWEAFRMNYYFEKVLINNMGFPQNSWRSGVGYRTDCAVSTHSTNVTSQSSKINLNPVVVSPENLLSVDYGTISNLLAHI